jgi:hypothetical protein
VAFVRAKTIEIAFVIAVAIVIVLMEDNNWKKRRSEEEEEEEEEENDYDDDDNDNDNNDDDEWGEGRDDVVNKMKTKTKTKNNNETNGFSTYTLFNKFSDFTRAWTGFPLNSFDRHTRKASWVISSLTKETNHVFPTSLCKSVIWSL